MPPPASVSPPGVREARAGGPTPDRPADPGAASAWSNVPTRDRILLAAGSLVLLQLAFRAWAVYPSWFYQDDYRFLRQATDSPLDLDYLTRPFDSQFMPLGRALAWLVADSGQLNWTLTATLTLLLQLVASAACLWMLISLFGSRWAVLAPLSLYLTGAMTMSGFIWWAAALNQLPLHAVLFSATACWVRYLRGEGRRWLALTLLVLAVGLLAYVKVALVFVVLAFLLFAYFSEGGPVRRIWAVLRRFWLAGLTAGGLAAAYTVYYVTEVPSVLEEADRPIAGTLAESMLGRSLATGLLGGPWRWDSSLAPVSQANPPLWSVHATWAALAVFGVVLALVRRRTGRAWLLLAGYSGLAFLVVYASRAPIVGGQIGAEYRYLSDVAALAPLCLALATLPLRGAVQSSQLREPAVLLVRPGPRSMVVLTALVSVSGLLSARAYAAVWHQDNAGEAYVQTVQAELAARGTVDLADQVVPASVLAGFVAPENTTAYLVPILDDDTRFPDVSSRLMAFDDEGRLWPAGIDAAAESEPGRDPRCGWQVDRGMVSIPLDGRTFDYEWWLKISYRAAADTEVRARAGDSSHTLPLRAGLNALWVRADGEFSSVTLGPVRDDALVCVDHIEVGLVEPEREEDR